MQKSIRVGLVEGREQDRLRLAALIGGGRGLALDGAWESVDEALPAVTLGGPEVLLLGIQTAEGAAID